MQLTGQVSNEVEVQALGYIVKGYQRLLTFECQSGGFNWWVGDNPGNSLLTAIGIMEFVDMSEVTYVDPKVIERSIDYVLENQNDDGSWSGESYLHGYNKSLGEGSLRGSAVSAWALAEAGYQGVELNQAVAYLKAHLAQAEDVYTRALVANVLAAVDPGDQLLAQLLAELGEEGLEDGAQVHWTGSAPSMTGTSGGKLDVETTALAALAMVRHGGYPLSVEGAIDWLISQKTGCGWGNTQATVLVLRLFVEAAVNGTGGSTGQVFVQVNGQDAGVVELTQETSEILQYLDLKEYVETGTNEVALQFTGAGGTFYQLVHSYHEPWPVQDPAEVLDLQIDHGALSLEVGELLAVQTRVSNVSTAPLDMVMATVGIPPGFRVLTSGLEDAVDQGIVNNFEVRRQELVLYVGGLDPGEERQVDIQMRPSLPVEAEAPGGSAYLYYNKEIVTRTLPVKLVVVE